MPTLNIGGQSVTVDDSFMSLPPDQQSATVEEIAGSFAPARSASTAGLQGASGEAKTAVPLPKFLADIPHEAYSATSDALSSAATNLNPFSDQRKQAMLRGDIMQPFLDTGKGLLSAAGAPFAPITGAARSLIGHPYSDLTGIPYDKAKDAVDTAMMGIGAKAGLPARPVPAMPPALEANIAAQNIGVELPRAIGTDSPFTKFMGQVANKMPGGGPMQERIGAAVGQTGDAVANAAQMAGGAVDPMAAGQGFKTGIETSFKPTVKARVGQAYDDVANHLDKNYRQPLNETQGAIADIVARRQASGEADPGKAVNTVLGGAMRPGGLTFEGVKDLRTRVGEMLDTGVFPEGMSQGELRRIYGSLSDDLKSTVQAAGTQKALQTGGNPNAATDAFNRANSMHKFVKGWEDNLGKVLGTDRSGEGITSSILRMASNGSTGDLKALTMARAAVPKGAWQDIASTAVSTLGKDRKGEFSPAIFLNDYAKLSDRGKTLLFGSVGSGDVVAHLNDISTVSKKFVEAGKLANTSGTAGHNAAYTMLGGAAAGLMHGSLLEPVTAVTTVIGNNLMARALSAPASAASVAKWSRAYSALATQPPAPSSIAAFNIATRNLANTINGQFGVHVQPADFIKAIQAPATGRADDNQQGVPRPPAQ